MIATRILERTNSSSKLNNGVHLLPMRNLTYPCRHYTTAPVRQCRAGIKLSALFDITRDDKAQPIYINVDARQQCLRLNCLTRFHSRSRNIPFLVKMHLLTPFLLLASTAQAHCMLHPSLDPHFSNLSRPLLQAHSQRRSRSQRMDLRPADQKLPDQLWRHIRYVPRHAVLPEPRGNQHRHCRRRC
jgi:hypothetical protein